MTTQGRPGPFGRLADGLSGREWRWNGWLIGAALCLLVVASGIYNLIRFRITGDVPWGNSAADMKDTTYLTGLAVWVVAMAVTAYVGIARLPRRREPGVLAQGDRERFEAALKRITNGPLLPQAAEPAPSPPTPAPPAARPPAPGGRERPQAQLTQQIEEALARVLDLQERKNRRREIVLLVIGTAVGLFGPVVLGHLPGLVGG